MVIHGLAWSVLSIWLHLKSRSRGRLPTSGNTKSSIRDGRLGTSGRYLPVVEHKYSYSSLSRKSWIPTPFLSHIPFESLLKVVVAILGILEEEFLGFGDGHRLITIVYRVRLEDGQLNTVDKFFHITMYAFLLLSGIIDVFSLCLRLPRTTSMIIFSLSYFIDGLLFYIHTIGRDKFNTMTHSLLVLAIMSCFMFSLLRLYSPSNLTINLGLSCSILVQGLWFIQLGHLLFGSFLSPGEEITHDHIMLVAAYFVWEVVVIVVFILVLLGLLTVIDNRLRIWKKNGGTQHGTLFRNGRKGKSQEQCKLIATEEKEMVEEEVELQNVRVSLA